MRIIALFFFLVSLNAFGATCTTTTRTNYSTGQVLTSSALNADFNQLVTKTNDFDGGCITDNTIEKSALNSTDFATVTNGIREGCQLQYVDAATVGVGRCILSVSGNFVKTTTQTTVAMGCSGCSAELTSRNYYVYAKSDSSGTNLNLLISSSAPNGDGYDGTGNKILGRFYNNASSDIEAGELLTWHNNTYLYTDRPMTVANAVVGVDFFTVYFDDGASGVCNVTNCSITEGFTNGAVVSVTRSGTGVYTLTTLQAYQRVICHLAPVAPVTAIPDASVATITPTTHGFNGKTSAGALADIRGTLFCYARRKI